MREFPRKSVLFRAPFPVLRGPRSQPASRLRAAVQWMALTLVLATASFVVVGCGSEPEDEPDPSPRDGGRTPTQRPSLSLLAAAPANLPYRLATDEDRCKCCQKCPQQDRQHQTPKPIIFGPSVNLITPCVNVQSRAQLVNLQQITFE